MQYSKIVENVKANFGFPVVSVHTPDESIAQFADIGMELLSAKCLRTVEFILPPNQLNVLNPEEVQIIVDVKPYTGSANVIGSLSVSDNDTDAFYTRSEFTLNELLTFYNFSAGGIIQPTLANMTYNQMMYSFGAQFDWHYDNSTGRLYSTNIPNSTQALYVQAKVTQTYEHLSPEMRVWLYEYTLARTKQVEGRIRSKFKEGSIGAPSDGDTLLSEASSELTAAMEKLESFVQLNYGVRR